MSVREGSEYAHRVELPSAFHRPGGILTSSFLGPLDAHIFRVDPNSPDILLVTAEPIMQTSPPSETRYALRAGEPYYRVEAASGEQWERGTALDQSSNRRGLLLGPQSRAGFAYEGHTYPVRPDGEHCGLQSYEGPLVVVICAKPREGDAEGFWIDLFDGRSGDRIAVLDLTRQGRADIAGLYTRQIHFLGSRWVAIALDTYLRQLLLLDFQPRFGDAAGQ